MPTQCYWRRIVRFIWLSILAILALGAERVQGTEPAAELSLRIVADVDGSDRLSISGREILWIHRHWDWPTFVRINNIEWDPRHSPVLEEEPRHSLFTGAVNFSSARVNVHQGRDTAVLETFDDHILIHFADSPNGRSTYDLTITFNGPGGNQEHHARRAVREETSQAGLAGMAYVQQERTNVVFRYGNGMVFAPSLLEGAVVSPGQVTNGVEINLRGKLDVPKDLTVRVRHAGGSSSRGYTTLSIDGKAIETLGDDLKKVSESILELSAGEHSVEWKISGGVIGHCLLECADAATGLTLSLSHTQEDLEELGANTETRFIDVQSKETGWPIPAGWNEAVTNPTTDKSR